MTVSSHAIVNGVRVNLNFAGTWNASTNTPTLASGTGSLGDFYRVSDGGSTTLDSISDWSTGDDLYFDGTVWRKIDNQSISWNSIPWGEIATSITASTYTGSGLCADFTQVQNAVGSSGVGTGDQGPILMQVTSTIANNSAYVHIASSPVITELSRPIYIAKFLLSLSLSDVRFFSGFAADATSAPVEADDPAFDYFGLQFSSARADTNFQLAYKDTGSQVLVDTGVAPVLNTLYRFQINIISTTEWKVGLWADADGAGAESELLFEATLTDGGNLPPSFTIFSGVQTLTTATRAIGHSFIRLGIKSGISI